MANILEELKKIMPEENILVNEPMKNHTTFKVGGPADYLVMPETKEQRVECLKLDVPKFILGNGSNLIVKDGGIRGLVIKTSKLDKLEFARIFLHSLNNTEALMLPQTWTIHKLGQGWKVHNYNNKETSY